MEGPRLDEPVWPSGKGSRLVKVWPSGKGSRWVEEGPRSQSGRVVRLSAGKGGGGTKI